MRGKADQSGRGETEGDVYQRGLVEQRNSLVI